MSIAMLAPRAARSTTAEDPARGGFALRLRRCAARVAPLLLVACLLLEPVDARAQALRPLPILPDALSWFGVPNNAALKGAWVLGAEQEAGTYVLRVTLAAGGRIPPHTHPDTRYSTVLAGTLHVGFGEVAREEDMVAVPQGGVYVAPAGVPHYLWARDGDVVYQEAGVGPTATLPARR